MYWICSSVIGFSQNFASGLKSLFQHYSSKASVLQHSAFFIVQLSHPYMTTGKTIALIRRTFVGKVMSLLFNMLSAQRLKNLPGTRETWVWSLGQEDTLEKEMATHSSILDRRIPWMEEPGGLKSMGSQRVGHDWATSLHFNVSAFTLAAGMQLLKTVAKYT